MVVTVDGRQSLVQTVALAPMSPAIFPQAVFNQNWTVNSAAAPALAGGYLQVFLTGFDVPSGWNAFALVNGTPVTSGFYTGDWGSGVEQVNFQIPTTLSGANANLQLCGQGPASVQKFCSQQVTFAVGAAAR